MILLLKSEEDGGDGMAAEAPAPGGKDDETIQ